MKDINVGDVVQGIVTGVEKYGIFVKLDNNFTGLIHISEIRNSFIKDISKFADIGEKVFAEVKSIDNEKKQIILSVKNLNYRSNINTLVKESVRGFYPLKQNLPVWLEEKKEEYGLN